MTIPYKAFDKAFGQGLGFIGFLGFRFRRCVPRRPDRLVGDDNLVLPEKLWLKPARYASIEKIGIFIRYPEQEYW